MRGKSGNLLLVTKEGQGVSVDGPAKIMVKQIKRNKVIILINADDETNIKRESTEEIAEGKGAKD